MRKHRNDLPDTWQRQTIDEIAEIETQAILPELRELYVYVGLENVESVTGEFINVHEVDGSKILSQKYVFNEDHVLYGKLRPYLNKVALPNFSGICSTDILPIRPKTSVLKEYLAYWLKTDEFISYANNHATGTKMPRLSPTAFRNAVVPVPLLPVQEQIVAVLQKADDIRRKRQEATIIADTILDSAFSSMFGNPASNATLNVLSKGISSIRNGLTRRRKTIANEGTIVLRIQDVGDGQINFDNINRIELDEDEEESFLLKEGDLLLVRVNGNKDLVGRNALFAGYHEPVAHNDHLMRIRFNKNLLLPEYVSAFLHTSFGRHELSSKVATSAGNHTINQNGIGSIRIPYSSIRSQEKFVSTVNYFQRTRTRLVSGLDESRNMFSSLLSRAFTGELTAGWETTNTELIVQQQRLYERLPQLLLLAFLHEKQAKSKAAKTALLVTALMKYVFLFQMEATARRRLYRFIPYHYGPFAKELYADLEALREQGFITIDNGDDVRTQITLTGSGELEALFSDIPDDIKEDVASIVETYGELNHSELLHEVYGKYPAYAQKSRLKRPQR
jgi:type I restriction enzyme S subunit